MSKVNTGAGKRIPDSARGVLWILALVLLAYALPPAWAWVQETWYEMNHAAPTWTDRGVWALREVGPLVLALGLMAVLWRTVGPPFSRSREVPQEVQSESVDSDRKHGDLPAPPTFGLPRPIGKGRISGPAGAREAKAVFGVGSRFWVGAWTLVSWLIAASAGWALLCVACAAQSSGWPMTEANDIEILTWGLVPIGVALCLALVLWALVGPPFRRSAK